LGREGGRRWVRLDFLEQVERVRRAREVRRLARQHARGEGKRALLPAVLNRPAFTVLARHVRGALAKGAVAHWAIVLTLSACRNLVSDLGRVDAAEALALVGRVHPGSSVTDFAQGADLRAMGLPAMDRSVRSGSGCVSRSRRGVRRALRA
jgi:hypothetical protein